MSADDRDRVMRIIKARCHDALSADDLALLATEPDDTLPLEIAEAITDAIAEMEAKLDQLAEAIVEKDDGDHDRRGDRRPASA